MSAAPASGGTESSAWPVVIVGAGDLGMRVARLLAARDRRVVAVRRSAAESTQAATAVIEHVRADATDPASLAGLADRIAALVVILTPDERSAAGYRRTYVDATETLLQRYRGPGRSMARLVFVSSTAVYGFDDGRWVDETTPIAPVTPTAAVLAEAEALAVDQGPERTTIVRLAGLYGGASRRLIDGVRNASLERPAGTRYTNRIHRDDAAALVAAVVLADDPPAAVIGVDEDPAPADEVYTWLGDRLGVELRRAPSGASRSGANKRCRSLVRADLVPSLAYPTFREGYDAILDPPQQSAP